MRQIKFKGKSLKTGDWFFGNLYDQDTHGRTHICTTRGGCLCIDPETVGQYTGLHDRVGKEIYEGDIIEYCSGCDSFGSVWQTVRVEFRAAEGGYVGVNQYRQTRDGRDIVQNIARCLNKCIVVGNIHDKTDEE